MTEQTEVETKARELGWQPKEEFRGDPTKWVDAAEYVERGETMIPLIRAQSRKLQEQVSGLTEKLKQANETIKASQESIEALKEFNSAENRRRMKESLAATKAALVKAKEDRDVEAEVELTERFNEESQALRAAEKQVEEKPEKPERKVNAAGEEKDYTATKEWKEWAEQNPWYGVDKRRTAMALAVADEIRANPETKSLIGRQFLDKVTEEVEAFFEGRQSRTSKVEGGGRPPSGGGGNGKSYSDLPQDAKEACERQAARLVGDGRAFKTMDEWRKHYTAEFFKE